MMYLSLFIVNKRKVKRPTCYSQIGLFTQNVLKYGELTCCFINCINYTAYRVFLLTDYCAHHADNCEL